MTHCSVVFSQQITTSIKRIQQQAAMARCRKFLLLLGFVGSMFLIMSVYQWDMFQVNRACQQQELRKQILKKTCNSDEHAFVGGKHTYEDLNARQLKNLMVDDEHGIIYCYIPKVACTNWKRVMFALKGGEPYKDPMSINSHMVHFTKKLTLLSSLPLTEIKARLKHYTKFLFVRDPFVRLISAYRNKFEHYNNYYFETYARTMLQRYGKPVRPKNKSKVRPSFYNFIQYLVDPRTPQLFEPHWRQMNHLCLPCLIQYDFIGHQETLQKDAEQLLTILKLEKDIKFPPSYPNMTSHDSVLDWFRAVPLKDRKKLFKVYELDFNLFGYERPSELLDG